MWNRRYRARNRLMLCDYRGNSDFCNLLDLCGRRRKLNFMPALTRALRSLGRIREPIYSARNEGALIAGEKGKMDQVCKEGSKDLPCIDCIENLG